jgi:hypothetical protein
LILKASPSPRNAQLHFNGHQAYVDIYSVGSRLTKEPSFYKCFAANGSAFGAIDPQVSRVRRAVMSPFFSRRAVLLLEEVIQRKVYRFKYPRFSSMLNSNIGKFTRFQTTKKKDPYQHVSGIQERHP